MVFLIFRANLFTLKKLILLLIFAVSFQISTAQEAIATEDTSPTTYYLIRHAEKDRSDGTNKNPGLTKKGFFRADRWAELFDRTSLDAIYSTNYDRTLMTASPTATSKELEIQIYDPRDLYSEEFQKATSGKTVLVVGHSNTTPAFVNAIIGDDRYADMDDNDNSSLFIVTIIGTESNVQILKVN